MEGDEVRIRRVEGPDREDWSAVGAKPVTCPAPSGTESRSACAINQRTARGDRPAPRCRGRGGRVRRPSSSR